MIRATSFQGKTVAVFGLGASGSLRAMKSGTADYISYHIFQPTGATFSSCADAGAVARASSATPIRRRMESSVDGPPRGDHPELGKTNTATSEAEPHARSRKAEPR